MLELVLQFNVRFIDMRSELAYLLGAYLSDGCLVWGQYTKDPHPKWIIKDESFADCISIALAKVGSPHSCYRRASKSEFPRSYWHVAELSGGKLGRWLHRVSPEKERLPEIPKDLARPLIAGLMDGDGYISARAREGGGGNVRMGYCGERDFVPDFYKLMEFGYYSWET